MQFLILGYDGKDEKALERRMAVRENHLANVKTMIADGQLLYAAGILNDEGKMIGSMMVAEFESREEMNEKWLNDEPYITGKVWEKIKIHPVNVPPLFGN